MTRAALTPSTFDWLFKYKIYHIPFWFVYHYLWWTITIGNPVDAMHNIFHSAYSFKYCFYVIFQAIGAYFNLYFLIPRFLEKGKYGIYLLCLALTITLTALVVAAGYYFSAWVSLYTFEELYQRNPNDAYFEFVQLKTLPSTVAAMTLAMSVKLAKNWLQSRRREAALEQEKLEAELKFLKSQFNPHFLFNTINSIFVLINKDPRMASEALAKFSDILRYQLYECNEQQIPLHQELGYISNYIELQKLRQDHDMAMLTVDVDPGPTSNLMIAPFILMPFLENAFKHVSRDDLQLNWITVRMTLSDNVLSLRVGNSVSQRNRKSVNVLNYGGLGLKNVRRRLDLLYPGRHVLKVDEEANSFVINLSLHLDTDVQRHQANAGTLLEQTEIYDSLRHH